MTAIKRYITESTKDGKTVREERIVYVSRSGEKFKTAQDAYRNDIEEELRAIIGPAVDPVSPGYAGGYNDSDYHLKRGMAVGFDKAIKRMLVNPESVIRLLETWNTNRNS